MPSGQPAGRRRYEVFSTDRSQPGLHQVPHLSPFHFSPNGIHHNKASLRAAPAKSHPVWDVDFTGDGFGGNAQIADSEKAGAEEQALDFGDNNFVRLSFIEHRF